MDVLNRLLRDLDITAMLLDKDWADRAIVAKRCFSKVSHPAGLNLSDCYSYALTDLTELALLCTDADFAATHLTLAVLD
jgi:ribonuclease VapC